MKILLYIKNKVKKLKNISKINDFYINFIFKIGCIFLYHIKPIKKKEELFLK